MSDSSPKTPATPSPSNEAPSASSDAAANDTPANDTPATDAPAEDDRTAGSIQHRVDVTPPPRVPDEPAARRAWLERLRATVGDLAREQRALHQRVERLISAIEDETPVPPPAAPRPVAVAEPRSSRLRRVVRRVAGKTVGVARGVWAASAPDDRVVLTLDPRRSVPPSAILDDSALEEHRHGAWPDGPRRLARWLLAAQDLDFVHLRDGEATLRVSRGPADDSSDRPPRRRRSARVVAQVVPIDGHSAERGDPDLPAWTRTELRPMGAYRVPVGTPRRELRLPLACGAPATRRSARPTEGSSSARPLHVLLTAPLSGGVESFLSRLAMRRHEAGEPTPRVIVFEPTPLGAPRTARSIGSAFEVLPLGDALPRESRGPAAAALLATLEAGVPGAVLHLGSGEGVFDSAAWTDRLPAAPFVDLAFGGPLLEGPGVRPAWVEHRFGSTLENDRWMPLASGADDPDASPEEIRRRLGLPATGRLVVWFGDWTADERPEDVVELAQRMGDSSSDLHFVLAGRGPLAGGVGDLARLLDADRLHLRPDAARADLLEIADIGLSTAERRPFPQFLVDALAAGCPVAATDVDSADRIVASGGALAPPGDLDALAHAIRRALELPRAAALDQGRALVEEARRAEDRLHALLDGTD